MLCVHSTVTNRPVFCTQDAIQPTAVGACAANDAACQATEQQQQSFALPSEEPTVRNELSGSGTFLTGGFLRRDAMQARSMLSCGVCPSVCVRPSVTFVGHVRTNKHIFELFFTVG